MYKIILSITLGPLFLFAATPALNQLYVDFQTSYSQTLLLSKDKNLFLKEFDQKTKLLKKKYDSFSKAEDAELTPEAHQIILDLEMLEPLEFLASSRINKESCAEADLLNEMNSTSDYKIFQKIKESIQTLCR